VEQIEQRQARGGAAVLPAGEQFLQIERGVMRLCLAVPREQHVEVAHRSARAGEAAQVATQATALTLRVKRPDQRKGSPQAARGNAQVVDAVGIVLDAHGDLMPPNCSELGGHDLGARAAHRVITLHSSSPLAQPLHWAWLGTGSGRPLTQIWECTAWCDAAGVAPRRALHQ